MVLITTSNTDKSLPRLQSCFVVAEVAVIEEAVVVEVSHPAVVLCAAASAGEAAVAIVAEAEEDVVVQGVVEEARVVVA